MAILNIERLAAVATIGAFAWEQLIQQTIYVDIEAEIDVTAAAASDNLADAVDYSQLSTQVIEFIGGTPCKLLETLALAIQNFIQENFALEQVRITVHKPHAIPQAKSVSLQI